MVTVKYKGFEISPAPYPPTNPDNWELRVIITKHHNSRGESLSKPYTGRQTFKSKEEADAHAIEFGKQIIDGKQPDLTLDELL